IGTSASDHAIAPFLYRLSDGTYRLYYSYYNGTYQRLSYKTSANGINNWSLKTDLGIGTGASDWADAPFLYRLSDGTYRLYYSYYNGIYQRLSYKTSANGITGWSTRVDLGIGTGASDHAYSPFLYRLSDGTYRLYYSYYNGTYWQLSYKTSANGINNWSLKTDLGIGTGASDWAIAPFLYRLSDGTYRLYYSYYNGTYWQLSYRTQTMVSVNSVYESDTLELSSSAQGDRLLVQASIPTGSALSYKIRSRETDGSWSAWTTPISVVTGLSIFDVSALTGKYWRIGFNGTSDGTASWTMGGFAVIPKPAGYSSLIEIVNPADIQNLPAQRYVQYFAFGDTAWNINDVTLQSKFQVLDLKHADFSIGNTNLKNINITTTDIIYNIALSNTETAVFADASLFDAATVATVDLGAKTAIAINMMQARWIAVNILAISPAAITFAVYAKTDLNNSISPRFKLFKADGSTEETKVGTGEDQKYSIAFNVFENKMDDLSTPVTNGKKYWIESVVAGNKVLKSVGFKITGEGSQYLYFSETDDFATAVLANSNYFIFISDVIIGTKIPFYVWSKAPITASVGIKNVEFTYWRWVTGE
nr:hypothetical protein [Pseudomonadota bacterium]